MYSSGNSMVPDVEPKEKECSCGGKWEDVKWCQDFGDECGGDNCDSYNPHHDCPNREIRQRCQSCDILVDKF